MSNILPTFHPTPHLPTKLDPRSSGPVSSQRATCGATSAARRSYFPPRCARCTTINCGGQPPEREGKPPSPALLPFALIRCGGRGPPDPLQHVGARGLRPSPSETPPPFGCLRHVASPPSRPSAWGSDIPQRSWGPFVQPQASVLARVLKLVALMSGFRSSIHPLMLQV